MHVCRGYGRTGVESVVLDLADGLRRAGGKPILVPHAEGVFAEEARDLGFEVWSLGKKRRYDVARIPAMARLIEQGRVDVLHSHAINGAFYACPAGRLVGVRSQVCSFHSDAREVLKDFYRWSFPRLVSHRYYLALTRWCGGLIAGSEMLRDKLVAEGIPEEKLAVIPVGVDVELFDKAAGSRAAVRRELGMAAETPLIGTVARLDGVKNLPMFLEVARRLLFERPQVRFVIAGDGPERDALDLMAHRLGIASKIEFLGWRDDPAEFTSALDLFLVTSNTEDGPLTAIGAMALGIPVVATRVGIMPEIEELERMGLLVPCGDVDAMVKALTDLLDGAGGMREVGNRLQDTVRRGYTKDVMVRRTLDLYSKVLGGCEIPIGMYPREKGG